MAAEADREVTKQVTPEIKMINERDRTMQVVITTKGKDRDGDIIEPTGVDFTQFMKNPVVLWAHDMSKPPIGKILSYQTLEERVEAVVQFAETPFAKEIFQLYRDGFMKAFSIGFLYKKGGVTRISDDEGNLAGYHVTAIELLELSAVPVPANADALMKGIKNGVYKTIAMHEDGEVFEVEEKKEKTLYRWHWDKTITDAEGTEVEFDIGKGAFTKTLHERVAAGKAHSELDPELEGGFSEFEIIKEVDGVVTEARITRVVLGTKSPTVEETAGEEEKPEPTQNTADKAVAVQSSQKLRLKYLHLKERSIGL